eukprot:6381440-Pyramimonas_sp.AAC.1
MAAGPAALTGTTGNDEESAAAGTEGDDGSGPAASPDDRLRIPYARGKSYLSVTEDVDAGICA